MENQFDDIMSRIQARQTEMAGGDEQEEVKENKTEKIVKEEPTPTPTKILGLSSKSNDSTPQKTPVNFRTTAGNDTENTENTSSTKKASRFSMLAQEIDDYEYDYQSQYNKPKEAYMKGRSPRMSIGETRPSVLCTPGGAQAMSSKKWAQNAQKPAENPAKLTDFESRRIQFAQPVANVNYLPNESSLFSAASDQSTVLGGSADMMHVTTSSLSCSSEISMNRQITHENTMLNSQSCENREAILQQKAIEDSRDEYGAHTFLRKKVPKEEIVVVVEAPPTSTVTQTAFSSSLVSSPKPFSKELSKTMFSPVHFTPKSTSSPKTSTTNTMSPSKSVALEASVAKTRMAQWEKQLKNEKSANPSPPAPTTAPIPTPRHVAPHAPNAQKKLFSTNAPAPQVAVAPIPVQTQWRGQSNTPVVQGARADEKTAGADVLGAGAGKLKNLKSRWEFSSATGTPIHPDATEDSLIATAIKMKETAIPKQIGHHRSIYERKGPSASSIHSQEFQKNQYEKEPEEEYEELPEHNSDDEEDLILEEEPEDQEPSDPLTDTSRFIDHAFGFMEGGATPSPAPLAKAEEVTPIRAHFEQQIEPQEPENEPEEHEKKGDQTLAYSVSFYRKIQRDRVGEASGTPLTPVLPSAPPMSLTSPQKLKQLTTSSKKSQKPVESEQETIDRLSRAIRVEEELVIQSKRAMAMAREKPSFRGSREEFEAQWALLVHVEKHRALKTEYERFRREGHTIIDGPRGTITITNLSVNMARDYVSASIASAKKSDEVFYFVAVLRSGEKVDVSKMVTSDGGLNRRGTLEFPMPLQLTAIPSDFRATVEIYGQRSLRESTTHEDKYKLKGSTLKAKTRNTFLSGGTTSSAANSSIFGTPTTTNQDLTDPKKFVSNFNLLGTFSFDINCPGKHIYSMSHTVYPLEGVCMMKVRKQAVDGADVSFNGFLSMYQRTREGLGSWTRYWCVLDNGEMKFWRHPEDEGTKNWLVLLDLSTCCRTVGASVDSEICPYPNSFNIDVWVPKEDLPPTASSTISTAQTQGIEQLRVKLAADTETDLAKWLSVINSTSKQLCTWRNPIVL